MSCPILHKNEGTTDRVLRVVVGITALIAAHFLFTGVVQTLIYVVGVIALITGVIGFCAIYALLGISTKIAKK